MPAPLNHLLLVAPGDALDPNSCGGIPHSLFRALSEVVPKVSVVGAQQLRPQKSPMHWLLGKVLAGDPPRWPLWMTEASLRNYARVVEQALAFHKPDAVLSISSQYVAMLRAKVPSYIFQDAPWMALKEAYASWEKFPLDSRRFGRRDAQAAAHATLVFPASDWAIQEGMRLYNLPRERFVEANVGANWAPSYPKEDLAGVAEARIQALGEGSPLQLLFFGEHWERQGGPLALEIAAALRAAGWSAYLHIAGCSPSVPPAQQEFTTVHGALNLGDDDDRDRIEALFLGSHFLLVPAQAECTGIPYAEAQAFAVPPVGRSVQAVPNLVADGDTGLLLAPEATAQDYADRIGALLSTPRDYVAMAERARDHYESQLNWRHCASTIKQHIAATLIA